MPRAQCSGGLREVLFALSLTAVLTGSWIGAAQATEPMITWANPADIVFPTPLSAMQLNATADVPGTFEYTPPSGTVLGAGPGQSLTVLFTPDDLVNFTTAYKNVTINVGKGTPVITWANPADIVFGTPLSSVQLNATANVPGTFAYTPPSGTVLPAGLGHLLSVLFTPSDFDNLNTASASVSINVSGVAPGHINLAWDDCSPAGTASKHFACDSNTGQPFTLIASFMPPVGINEFLGAALQIGIRSDTAELPDWWKFGAGNCRGTTGLGPDFSFLSGPFTCADFTYGAATGGMIYDIDFGGPHEARLTVQYAVPFDNRGPLDESTEYYAAKIAVLRSKSTGVGSCAGCDVPATLTLDQIQLFQPPALGNDPILTLPIVGTVVDWQTGDPPAIISIDARELSESTFQISDGVCIDGSVIQTMEVFGAQQVFKGCASGAQVAFEVDALGHVTYAPSLEGMLSGSGTSTLVIHGFPINVDARDVPDLRLAQVGPACYPGGQEHPLRLLPAAYSLAACVFNSDCLSIPSSFGVDAAGHVTYDPLLEGSLGGAGTSTLAVHLTFPPAGDDNALSVGLFRIVVEPEFWDMMEGYPGYGVVNGLHRLVSPSFLLDYETKIGRSGIHRDGDAADVGGTPVGTAGTIISDANFSALPPGFQGPPGTLEVHTEIRSLNMVDHGGSGVAVRAGIHAPGRPISPGEIQGGAGGSELFPAESFFNVFVEVDLPLLGTLYNSDPLMVENSGIICFPPQVVYLHKHTGPVSVLFKADDTEVPQRWHAGDRFGWLVLAGHGYDFDPPAAAAALAQMKQGGPRLLGDPFAEFEDLVNSEPEMADTATVVVDLHDVLTFTDSTAFTQPTYQDSLTNGLNAAAALGQAGDPCAGIQLITDMYARVDGFANPPDWVNDPAVRQVLANSIHALGALLQAQANQSGGCQPTAVPGDEIPSKVAILAIRPNPTGGEATISYAIPARGHVTMAVYDLTGRLVQRLVDGELPAGTHRAVWDGRRDRTGGRPAMSGTYFVRIHAAGVTQMKRLVLVR